MKNAINFQQGAIDMEKARYWGGARADAGRKAAPVPKKQRNLRLTDEEYAVVKEPPHGHPSSSRSSCGSPSSTCPGNIQRAGFSCPSWARAAPAGPVYPLAGRILQVDQEQQLRQVRSRVHETHDADPLTSCLRSNPISWVFPMP